MYDDLARAGYKSVRIALHFWQVADGKWAGKYWLTKPDATREEFKPLEATFPTREDAKESALQEAHEYIDRNF
jgi:hypothetical protein